MEKRPLGRSGISIAPLMFGGNVLGWTADEATSFSLDAFTAGGFNAIDTADVYSAWIPGHTGGESETVIGNWLKRRGRRDDVVIATKVGMWPKHSGLKRETIMAAAEESLQRLQTDYIDLYQSHRDDAETPLDETLEAFSRLVEQGKVRAIGASNYDADRLREALGVSVDKAIPRYETLQPEYNLVNRKIEADLVPLCIEEGLGIISYYGLAGGFLTGKYRTEADLGKSPRGRTVKRYMDERGLHIVDVLETVAAETVSSPAQVALAWVMSRPAVTAPLASATSLAQLDDIMGSARLTLTPEQIKRLDDASA
jgi:aryl-alcohol dehydrogenase-like predicted oxidoreductase